MKYLPINKIRNNPDNPRVIKNDKFKKLLESIKTRSGFMEVNPIKIDEDNMILGGNMRFKACQSLGWDKIPTDTFTQKMADGMNDKLIEMGLPPKTYREFCDEFVVIDNISFGTWDADKLANQYEQEMLDAMGLDFITKNEFEIDQPAEIEFSEVLGEAQNYVVLTFSNEIDWLAAQTHFRIKSVYSQRANGKPWSKGIGRVLDGAKYLKDLQDELE